MSIPDPVPENVVALILIDLNDLDPPWHELGVLSRNTVAMRWVALIKEAMAISKKEDA